MGGHGCGAGVGCLGVSVQGSVGQGMIRFKHIQAGFTRQQPSSTPRVAQVAFAKITGVFKRHGAVSIDTPVFELRC